MSVRISWHSQMLFGSSPFTYKNPLSPSASPRVAGYCPSPKPLFKIVLTLGGGVNGNQVQDGVLL